MHNIRIRFGRTLVLTVGLLTSGVGGIVVMAQGQNPLEQIERALQELQQSVDALGASSNIAVTPALRLNNDLIACKAVNVADTNRDVRLQLINFLGEVVFEETRSVVPGGIGTLSASFFGSHYCRFTVLNGTKADIRGSFEIQSTLTTSVSVTAE